MASMSPELELMIFMTPIFTDKAELALEVFKYDVILTSKQVLMLWDYSFLFCFKA